MALRGRGRCDLERPYCSHNAFMISFSIVYFHPSTRPVERERRFIHLKVEPASDRDRRGLLTQCCRRFRRRVVPFLWWFRNPGVYSLCTTPWNEQQTQSVLGCILHTAMELPTDPMVPGGVFTVNDAVQ